MQRVQSSGQGSGQSSRIVSVEWAILKGKRPRAAGSNARLGPHGLDVRVPILRIGSDDGASGFGAYYGPPELASALLGMAVDELFAEGSGVSDGWRAFEYPLWDLAGQRAGLPVYALAATVTDRPFTEPFRAPCYDTSLYFDDLHLERSEEAAQLIAAEAREGYSLGHRAFKIKVGRGARHLPLEAGTLRDIAVVRAVREAVGSGAVIMLDANNGYNLNLAKRVLAETADCDIFWLEEPFHEDDCLLQDLRAWLTARHLPVLIADGEGQADPRVVEWARRGLVDVIQYDIFDYGLTRWLQLGPSLDAAGVRSAPHHYSTHYGNYAACHLAGAIQRFTYVEWDEATTEGLHSAGYMLNEGQVEVPNRPGFGITLDETVFRETVEQTGVRFMR